MNTPEPPAGYELKHYKPGEVVGDEALYWSSLDTWEPSNYVGDTPSGNNIYAEPIRPRELRWYDLSKGEKPTEADGDENRECLYRESPEDRSDICRVDNLSAMSSGYWHPIAKFPKPDPEVTAAIELLKSRGYSITKEER